MLELVVFMTNRVMKLYIYFLIHFSFKLIVKINGTIMKYKTKRKHQIYMKTLVRKTTDKGESFIMNMRKI